MSLRNELINEKVEKILNISGTGVFGIARVIGRNDHTNLMRVRIFPLSETQDFMYVENNHVEYYPFAEVMTPAKGENHGYYYTPEFGDFVIYTILPTGHYIIGSVGEPSWERATTNIPAEAQNIQANGKEYNTTHWPDLTTKGYHLETPVLGDVFQPASFLQRWRKNDILMYNATKIGTQEHSAVKLMEFRSSENNMLQLVDIGNFNIKPGIDGKNSKTYSPARQTDYRDLWEGFNVNGTFWSERTDKPPLTNESQYIKLATNGNVSGSGQDKSWADTGADLPDLSRGEVRWDDRVSDGSFETSKIYCPVYQTLKCEKGPDRYAGDKSKNEPYNAGVPYRTKVKKWIEDTGNPYDPKAQKFNVGHYLTLSNTIFKRRVMLSSAKGHQLVLSDIDKDEKILLNSQRGKQLYMEDSAPGKYDVMWLASQNHHMLFVDSMKAPFLTNDKGKERHRLVDPNQKDGSSFQLIQTAKYQKIWLADSDKTPRIHMHSASGHEVLLLDHDKGVSGCSPTPNKGKIQITTGDKMMQISLDVENGDISIQNHNLGGKGNSGDITLFAANNIKLKAKNQIWLWADNGFEVTSSGGAWNQDIVDTNFNCGLAAMGPFAGVAPSSISATVLSDIEVTEGKLINKFNPS
jgi:hypothetical protein